MTLRCDCGKELKDWRGARGHVQFSTDDGHGSKGDVPDGWKDLFDDLDADDEQDDDETDEQDDDETDEQDDDETDTDDETPVYDGRLYRALTDDVRALWGGNK
jgi:hypothetical protein